MPSARLVRPTRLFDGVPYAYAAVVPPGSGLVFMAGACPLLRDGTVVGPGDVVAQARQAMDNLDEALREAGAGLRHVVKSTVYVASSHRADLTAVWDVVRAHMGEHDAPSTLLGVAALGWPGQLVEIEAVAILP
jgi:enamine deaminase RidA (YjgF/YER057c/UK114 family)